MTKGIRTRIIALQAILALVLGGASIFLISEGNFVNGTIHDQLSAQQITFPPASTEVPGGALDPAVFPRLQQYAGQPVDSGDKAYAYATYFIGEHMTNIYKNPDTGKGMTYSEVSALAQKNPTDPKLAGAKAALFQGNTLQNMLLNAWGWSTLATYTLYGGYAMALAALVVLGALLFEIVLALRREPETVTVGGKVVSVA